MMRNLFLIFILAVGGPFWKLAPALGQESASAKNGLPIQVSMLVTGFGHSLSGMPSPKRSVGFTVGTELRYVKGQSVVVGQSFNVGWFFQKDFQNGVLAYTKPFVRAYPVKGAFVELGLGGGYAHNRLYMPGFVSDGNGNFTRNKRAAFGAPLATASFAVGYDFSKTSPSPITLFAETQTNVEFVGNQYMPVLPRHFFHLGTRIRVE